MTGARLERKRLGVALVNGCCDSPYAYVREGKLEIRSRHSHAKHKLKLAPADLRRIADEIERQPTSDALDIR